MTESLCQYCGRPFSPETRRPKNSRITPLYCGKKCRIKYNSLKHLERGRVGA